MAKPLHGTRVNRSAARKASEVAASRRARLAAHEAAVTAAVATFYDRTGRAEDLRTDAQTRARRLLADAETTAGLLDGEADQAVATLKRLGEPVVEIATLTGLPVSTVRSRLARAASTPPPTTAATSQDPQPPEPASAGTLEPARTPEPVGAAPPSPRPEVRVPATGTAALPVASSVMGAAAAPAVVEVVASDTAAVPTGGHRPPYEDTPRGVARGSASVPMAGSSSEWAAESGWESGTTG